MKKFNEPKEVGLGGVMASIQRMKERDQLMTALFQRVNKAYERLDIDAR